MKPEIQVEVCSLGDILRLGCLRSHAGMSGLFNRLLVPAALRVMSGSVVLIQPCLVRASDVCPANQPGISGMDAARAISEEDGWDAN